MLCHTYKHNPFLHCFIINNKEQDNIVISKEQMHNYNSGKEFSANSIAVVLQI